MSEPPMPEARDEVDDRYRQASALDPSRPGEAVRRRVLEHATRLAAEREAGRTSGLPTASVRRRAPRAWRPAIVFGTLAAAALAGLMIAPRFLMRPTAPTSRVASIPGQQPSPAPAPALEMAPFTQEERPAPAPVAVAPAAPPRPAVAGSSSASAARQAAELQERADVYVAGAAGADSRAADAAASGANAALANATVAAQQTTVTAARRAALAPPAAKVGDSAAEFRRAAESGDLQTLDRLLAMQPDINTRDGAGRTPLMLATLRGQTDVVSALLAYGADPNAADSRGITPLQAARAGAHPAIVAALQRYGAR